MTALNDKQIKVPICYEGTASTKLFLYWLERFLIPELEARQVMIMDNASIHKSYKVRKLIEQAGCYLIYFLLYSPDLNPIENYWAVLKSYIKKIRHKFDDINQAVDHALNNL